jgi:hypothetical protein
MKLCSLTFVILTVIFQGNIYAQESINVTEAQSKYTISNILLPNSAGKAMTTHSAWGAWGGIVFIGAGLTSPQVYSDKDDGAVSFGFGFGNPVKNIGVQISESVLDLSEQNNYSTGIKLHRYLGNGTAIALGAEHLFADKDESDADESYYIVISRASQKLSSPSHPNTSRIHLSLGLGSGRFAEKSEMDEIKGKGRNGTILFGAFAFEIIKNTNLVIEWNGNNLATGIAIKPFKNVPLGISLGVADLTSNSGDGTRFIVSTGFSFKII